MNSEHVFVDMQINLDNLKQQLWDYFLKEICFNVLTRLFFLFWHSSRDPLSSLTDRPRRHDPHMYIADTT